MPIVIWVRQRLTEAMPLCRFVLVLCGVLTACKRGRAPEPPPPPAPLSSVESPAPRPSPAPAVRALAVVTQQGLVAIACASGEPPKLLGLEACAAALEAQQFEGKQLGKPRRVWCRDRAADLAFQVDAPVGTLVTFPPDLALTRPVTERLELAPEVAKAMPELSETKRVQSVSGAFGGVKAGNQTLAVVEGTVTRAGVPPGPGRTALLLGAGAEPVWKGDAFVGSDFSILGMVDLDADGVMEVVTRTRSSPDAPVWFSHVVFDEGVFHGGGAVVDCAGPPAPGPVLPPISASQALEWLRALYPHAQLEQGALRPVTREGFTGEILERAVKPLAVEGGYLVAFDFHVQKAGRGRSFTQVLFFGATGAFIGKPEGFPIGGDDTADPRSEERSFSQLAVTKFERVEGASRAALLSLRVSTDSTWLIGVAVDAAGSKVVSGQTFFVEDLTDGGRRLKRTVDELHLEQREVRALTSQKSWFESSPSRVDPGSFHESQTWSTLVELP